MTEDLRVTRPWLRFASFLGLAVLLAIAASVVFGILLAMNPAVDVDADLTSRLPDSPVRLIGESYQVLFLGGVLGGLGFAILAAAALTYRRPLTDFLWPRRRFDAGQFGLGLLIMACISAVSVPFYLATGSEWAPPILDPQYLDSTRLAYVAAMVGGLLVAAAGEEVVCRGVLLRLTGFVTRHPLMLCAINGVIFSAIHLDPDPIAFVARAIAGGVWTWAALRLGGLEFAIGAHLANNLFIALFWQPFSEAGVSRESSLSDLAPEVFTAVVIVLFVERLARRSAEPPQALAPRPAA